MPTRRTFCQQGQGRLCLFCRSRQGHDGLLVAMVCYELSFTSCGSLVHHSWLDTGNGTKTDFVSTQGGLLGQGGLCCRRHGLKLPRYAGDFVLLHAKTRLRLVGTWSCRMRRQGFDLLGLGVATVNKLWTSYCRFS